MQRRNPLSVAAWVLLASMPLTACHAFKAESPAQLRGRLSLDVVPNPIVAVPVGDDLYELKFDIVMREVGGVETRIEDFTVDAVAFGTVTMQSTTYPASFITERGYPASIGSGQYLRFSFVKRWPLPTRLLLSGASARVSVRTVDVEGHRDRTFIRVGVDVSGKSGGDQGGS